MSDSISHLNELLAGRYRVERELGTGGMGTVYLAEDLKHDRRVALKVLHRDLTEMVGTQRFLNETRVTATLQHPHVLPLFDSGEVGGLLYYAMPYIEGESLRERLIRERGPLPVQEAARILRDVVDGLTAAHEIGVVHRDIKPENILLSGRHAILADFGIAKVASTTSVAPQRTTAGIALGTPDYMAPEQITADPHVDHRADLYAVGAVAYELLTGQPPFGGRPAPEVLLAHLTETPRPLSELRPSVSPDLGSLVMRCLEKRPADRWQDAESMLVHLDAAAAGLAGSTPAGSGALASRPRRRGLPGRALLAAGAAVAGLAAWVRVAGRPTAGGDSPGPAGTPLLAVAPLLGVSGGEGGIVWGRRAADAIASAIDSTGAVRLVPRTTIIELAGSGTASIAALAERAGATHATAGTVSLANGRLELTLEIVAVRDGRTVLLHALEPVAGPTDSADAVIGALARRAAAVVALVFRGIALPLSAERIPASPEVIGHLERASELGCSLRRADAARELRKALALDPGYVPALATLAYTEVAMGNWSEADSIAAILDGLSYRMLPGERLWWDYQSAINAGDWATAASAAEKGYRDRPQTWGHAAGYIALSTRRVTEALDRLLAARPADGCYLPQSGVFRLRAQAWHLLGRYDEELAAARRFLDRFPGDALAWESEVRALAATGRTAAVDSLLDWLAALPPQSGFSPVWGPIQVSLELRAHGHEQHAARVMQRALDTYSALPPEDAREERALTFFFAARWADADTLFAALLEGAEDSASNLRYRGTALARLGRRQEALEISDRFPHFEMRTHGRATYYRAAIAAALGDAATATYLLGEAFRNGYGYDVRYHRDPWWDPIRNDPTFAALIRPR